MIKRKPRLGATQRRTGEPVQPCHFDEALIRESTERLAAQIGRPFSHPVALRHLLILGGQLAPYLDGYDTVVAEGYNGTIAAAVIWHAVNAARQASGKQPAAFRFANGKYSREPLPDDRYFQPTDSPERLLLVAELIGSGDNMSNALQTVAQGRSLTETDVATVASTDDWSNIPFPSLEGTLFWHPKSAEAERLVYHRGMQVTLEEASGDPSARILGAAIFELARISQAPRA